jgi:hypothetical protein
MAFQPRHRGRQRHALIRIHEKTPLMRGRGGTGGAAGDSGPAAGRQEARLAATKSQFTSLSMKVVM